ncbi:hypothetical protein [Deinococcus puniceus]|uniref:hypothetical protein n=1 Tax=Deinococcus puniceus TaxID=1182568 RepID=UPI000A916068|nr:hypothetical protein [Deinococcus puniceus]
MTKLLLTVPEAIVYQREKYGHVCFGRDALYAIARSGKVKIVKYRNRKLLFPTATIDLLMKGETRGLN